MVRGRLKRRARRLVSALGFDVPTVHLLQVFQRPEWFVQRAEIPHISTFVSPPAPVTEADVALCWRLIVAYHQAIRVDEGNRSAIWLEILGSHYGPMLRALEGRDARELAEVLGSMFHQKFMFGIASTATEVSKKQPKKPFYLRQFNLDRAATFNILGNLVSLAEFLGVERAECPEQGIYGFAFRDGASALVARIEKRLGISITAPPVGAPVGLKIGKTRLAYEAPEHIYFAARALQILDAHLPETPRLRIVEIGAGFGAAAYYLLQMPREVESYRIIDLPTTNVLQGYYLSKSLGTDKVSLWGEREKQVHICPTHAIESQFEPFDLLLNENSMPEMPESAVRDYLCWASRLCRLFYSYNQEAVTPLTPQTLVPQVARECGRFRLLTRSRSWVRRGYVEEVYSREKGE